MYDRKQSLMYNADGYFDPTAGVALNHASKSRPNGFIKWIGQPVYICTSRPMSSDEDIQYLERCCAFAANQGAHPIAPLLFYSEIFDLSEESQRRQIYKWTRSWLRQASEIWVFDGEPPRQLAVDLQRSIRNGKAVRYFSTDQAGRFIQSRKVCNKEGHPQCRK